MPVLSPKGYRIKIYGKNKKRAVANGRETQKREAIRRARRWVIAWGTGHSANVSIDERNGALVYQCHVVSKKGKLELRGDEL